MTHIYDETFYAYIDRGSRQSARALIAVLGPLLRPSSVLDLGSGRGVWLDEWQAAGTSDILGVDGSYVERDSLAIPPERFVAADLTVPFAPGRRFDLAQSLEVGEHLPRAASPALVESLTGAADRVLFSAAVPGQGGEHHINERPLSFWQDLFAERGYTAFDCIRPRLKDNRAVEPWYRYNTLLYVSEVGRQGLPEAVLRHEVPAGRKVRAGGDALWRLRRALVSTLPRPAVTRLAQLNAKRVAARAPGPSQSG